jgi:hypothetical protein
VKVKAPFIVTTPRSNYAYGRLAPVEYQYWYVWGRTGTDKIVPRPMLIIMKFLGFTPNGKVRRKVVSL